MTGPPSSLAGRLLVANPRMADPNFDRSVVMVLAHGPDGALGVVICRPSAMPVAEPLGRWEAMAAEPAVVHLGGPVAPDSVICVAELRPGAAGAGGPQRWWRRLAGDLGTVDLDSDPDEAAASIARLRVFAGYAGWGSGQLEAEMLAGGWWSLESLAGDAFDPDPATLWHRVLRRQGAELAVVAAYPPEPRLQ